MHKPFGLIRVRGLSSYVATSHGYSERKACQLARQHRSTQRKPSTRDPCTALRQRMHEIVATRIRYGYRRVHVMLKRDGWEVGRNMVYRLYREEELVLRTKRLRRRKMAVHYEARCQPKRSNEAWTLDFIHDQSSSGQKFRALTVVDVFSREALAIEIGQRLPHDIPLRVMAFGQHRLRVQLTELALKRCWLGRRGAHIPLRRQSTGKTTILLLLMTHYLYV